MTEQQKKDFRVINGNSLDVLLTLEENSIDAIVTDPPYELGFMGKKWDSTGIAYNVELWERALRVLKPGGYLLAFGGSRTFHRIACAIEDAGFEIRDTIMWLYGSGFPKSHNVGLDIDKLNGCGDRGHRIAVANRHHPDGTLEPNGEHLEPYEAKTDDGRKWNGWGTALKPAFEPIIMARKPLEDTVAKNVLKYGVGAINIDDCRVGNETRTVPVNAEEIEIKENGTMMDSLHRNQQHEREETELGRFPANVITDGSDEVASGMPITNGAGGSVPNVKVKGYGKNFGGETDYEKGNRIPYDSGSGSAMRYFYQAKANKKDRDEGLDRFDALQVNDGRKTSIDNAYQRGDSLRKNIHPTVKPVELMQYLIRLVAPKGATILDIFNGSGSTGKAVAFENREHGGGYKYLGIELNKDYVDISLARIDYALNKYEYDAAKEKEENEKKGQIDLFDFDWE